MVNHWTDELLPSAVNTKVKGSCLAHHVDAVRLFDTTRIIARSDRKVHADPTEWTTARIRPMICMGNI